MSGRLALRTLVLGLACAFVSPICSLSRAADATQVARVAVVNPHSPSTAPAGTSEFRKRLRELGYIEGQNLVLDVRWADDQTDRLPKLVADAIGRKPDVLVTWGAVAAVAAKNATGTVPIVAVGMPLGRDLAANLAHSGSNLTGLSLGYLNIAGKWLELLKETVPQLSTVAVIANPENPVNRSLTKELETVAPARRLKLRVIEVRNQEALDGAFEQAHRQAQAVLVLPDSVLNANRLRLTALAAKHRLPSMHSSRGTVDAGGLMAYGPNFGVQWRRAADYVDKILKGSKPAELPIEEPTQFELAVNLRTAKALKLTIPESVLLRADEVVR
jgi:putative ABC transport system substrate-binding protein